MSLGPGIWPFLGGLEGVSSVWGRLFRLGTQLIKNRDRERWRYTVVCLTLPHRIDVMRQAWDLANMPAQSHNGKAGDKRNKCKSLGARNFT